MVRTLIHKKKDLDSNTIMFNFVMKREVKWIRLLMLCLKVIEKYGINSIKIRSIATNCALYASLL